jgi:hypothetical protein
MMALAPSSYEPVERDTASWMPWAFAIGGVIACVVLNEFHPFALGRFEWHHAAELGRFEWHHAAELARLGGSTLHDWPVWAFSAVSIVGLVAYYELLKDLLPEQRLAGLSTMVLASSVGALVLLFGPSIVGLQWSLTLMMALALFRWWQWRCEPRTNPPLPMQWQDCVMGAVLGGFAGLVGWLPTLWMLVLVALWFLQSTSKRYSLLEWWEDYRGVTTYFGGAWVVSLLALLVTKGMNLGVFLPMTLLPASMSWPSHLAVLATGLIAVGLPWGGYFAYAVVNILKHAGRRGRQGQLFDASDDALHRYALWTGVCASAGLLIALLLGRETSLFLVTMASVMAAYVGSLAPRYRRMLNPSKGLKRLSDTYPLLILGVGVLSAWVILTQLPDYYLPEVNWPFPGPPLIQESSELKGGLALFISIPVWKIWLLILPMFCVVGSAVLTAMQFVNFSLKRSMITLGVLSILYTGILAYVQWPVTHPAYRDQHAATLTQWNVAELSSAGLLPAGAVTLPMPNDDEAPARYVLVQEQRYYQRPPEHRGVAVDRLPTQYLSLVASPLLYHSLLDVFPFYTQFVNRDMVLVKAPVNEPSASLQVD